jgi:hypothetical protein
MDSINSFNIQYVSGTAGESSCDVETFTFQNKGTSI